jgi:hypothetical protein
MGTVSVAVQVAPDVKPVTTVTNGVLSDAEPEAGVGVPPLVHVTLTLTGVALSGWKSLFTVKVAVLRLLTIVQLCAERTAWHVPLEL